jgi:sulfate/thiosulfate transport system ATP-binding protein
VLLLDEPFGALDSRVRRELRRWLRSLHDELGITSVLVTHDQEEALELADRVVVMNHGRIEQIGTPEDVYGRPATPFVLEFLGEVNLFHGRSGEVGGPRVPQESAGDAESQAAVYVRPHLLEVSRVPRGGEEFRASVRRIHRAGPSAKIELVSDSGAPVQVDLAPTRLAELGLVAGMTVWLAPREKHVFFSDRDGI